MESNFKNNTAFMFLPFSCKDYREIIKNFDKNKDLLQLKNDDFKYILKYVYNKMIETDGKFKNLTHYSVNLDKLVQKENYSILNDYIRYEELNNIKTEPFKIAAIDYYLFSTNLVIISIMFEVDTENTMLLSNTYFSIKNFLGRTFKNIDGSKENRIDKLIYQLTKELLQSKDKENEIKFFPFLNDSNGRPNIFSFVDIDKFSYKNKRDEYLYYLSNCYNDTYLYSPDIDFVNYQISDNISWGLSSEATVCLTCSEMDAGNFIKSQLYKNFKTRYLMMYILLLHQKYVLYILQNDITNKDYSKCSESLEIKHLEEYKNKLYEFETDFVFTKVSEISQYQTLYNKLSEVFALRSMFEDVQEPLNSLAEMRKKNREDRINLLLMVISFLTVFSCLMDIINLLKFIFDKNNGDILDYILKCVLLAFILIFAVVGIILVLRNKAGKTKK